MESFLNLKPPAPKDLTPHTNAFEPGSGPWPQRTWRDGRDKRGLPVAGSDGASGSQLSTATSGCKVVVVVVVLVVVVVVVIVVVVVAVVVVVVVVVVGVVAVVVVVVVGEEEVVVVVVVLGARC